MARDAEVTALRAVEDAYQRWTVVSEELHQEVAAAAERDAGVPVDALRADFNAQVAVTRTVAAFALSCPSSGPDVEGLPGAAYILALHQVVASQPRLDQDLAALAQHWETWVAEVASWTANRGDPSPARPTSPAHSRVLAAVDDWWRFGADRLHDQLVRSMTAQGHHVTESITSGTDGEVFQSAQVVFAPHAQPDGAPPKVVGPFARLRMLLGRHHGR